MLEGIFDEWDVLQSEHYYGKVLVKGKGIAEK